MAQIVIVGVGTWSIIDGFQRTTGLLRKHTIPPVDCPVVDTGLISEDDAEALCKIIRSYIKPSGCVDVSGMITELEKLGAVAFYPEDMKSDSLNVAQVNQHV